MAKMMLIDGNSIINRAFYAIPLLSSDDGEYTNAVYGFLNILFKFYEEERPAYLAVAFDLPGPTFRVKIFADYKGTRKPMPMELRPQLTMLKNILRAMNIAIAETPGFEADDILGTLALMGERAGLDVVIVSGDRDLLQLATDKVMIRIPKTKGGRTDVEDYRAADVKSAMGVTPAEYIDVKALMGDVSDNIPGVPGIGEKTATKIIQDFGSLESAIEKADRIRPPKAGKALREYAEQAVMSRRLATIDTGVPLGFMLDSIKETGPDGIYTPEAREAVRKLDFKSMLGRFERPEKPAGAAKHEVYEDEGAARGFVRDFMDHLGPDQAVAFEFLELDGVFAGAAVYSQDAQDARRSAFLRASAGLSAAAAVDICRPLFESGAKKLVLDYKSALTFLRRYGLDFTADFDCMLGAYILDANRGEYDAADVARAAGLEGFEDLKTADELLGKGKKRVSPAAVSPDELAGYALGRAEIAFKAYPAIRRRLTENGQDELYYKIELPLARVLADMQAHGIRVDRDALTEYGKGLDAHIVRLTEEICALAGEVFNVNSPMQLSVILFEKLGLKGTKKTTQGYSTAADVLENLKTKHPIIPKILEYRTYAKLKSTYVDGLLAVIDPADGKIHSTFNQTVASTGRISSSEPNLQNIPIKLELGRLLRKVFVPSDENHIFLDGDYSQIELRVLAHISGDETFIRAFNEGQDIHRLTASQVFYTPFEEVTPLQRSNAKAVNFGIVYGIGSFSLSHDLNISANQADRYIKGYFEKYPRVKEYLDGVVRDAERDGYAQTIFMRRREIPELFSSNFIQRSFGARVAMNMPIQGSAADIIKIAMVNIHARLKREGLKSRLILQVHDELLIEARRDELEYVRRMAKEEMESAVSLKVELTADFHEGETWYDAK